MRVSEHGVPAHARTQATRGTAAARGLADRIKNPAGAAQIALFPPGEKLLRAFWQHRREHPWVWNELVRLALQAKAEGRTRMGIAALFEIARWNTRHEGRDAHGWKLDNDMRAYYSRALMQEHPALAGFFETRKLRSQ